MWDIRSGFKCAPGGISSPSRRSDFTPFVSVVMVVRNEEKVVEEKLRNLASLNYPENKIEVVVFSDGSTDRTLEVLSSHSSTPNLRVLSASHFRGKASALNDAVSTARGEVVVFTDARQKIESDAVLLLLENFADASVGCASGELILGDPGAGEAVNGYGLYWRIEKQMRLWESSAGSTVGATGAFYALRRNLFSGIPAETILDDVYLPLQSIRKGLRVVFDPRARAWDVADLGRRRGIFPQSANSCRQLSAITTGAMAPHHSKHDVFPVHFPQIAAAGRAVCFGSDVGLVIRSPRTNLQGGFGRANPLL